ncbi:MAG: hypothetical protein FD164_1389 [Nitrospirae bacterium]|nr:MAG: hypothetical protein FD164_1389 [Nitrospirota bacterium]
MTGVQHEKKGACILIVQISRQAVFALAAAIFFCFLAQSVDAAYKIVLKNGTEIIVEAYEKSGNHIRAEYDGGIIGISQSDVRSIQRVERSRKQAEMPTDPALGINPARKQRPPQQDAEQIRSDTAAAKRGMLQDRINEITIRIETLEKQKFQAEDEISRVRDRMSALQAEGKRKAVINGKDPLVRWKDFLLPEEYAWVNEKTIVIAELERNLKRFEDDLAPLSEDRAYYEKRLQEEQ